METGVIINEPEWTHVAHLRSMEQARFFTFFTTNFSQNLSVNTLHKFTSKKYRILCFIFTTGLVCKGLNAVSLDAGAVGLCFNIIRF